MAELLLITPPFTQLNTPYPATAYIKGFLNTIEAPSFQMDLGIEVILELFSSRGLKDMFNSVDQVELETPNIKRIFGLREHYMRTIDPIIEFLKGGRFTLARQICSGAFLPQASRFDQLDEMEWAFGAMGMQDKAKHIATLYLEDLSDFIVGCVDANFGFSRYAERLGRSANDFEELHESLQEPPTYIDNITLRILKESLESISPDLVCFSVPFPGNLYSAFRCAQFIKLYNSDIQIAMGGGFPNTELRSVSDPRVFDYFDFISLDDGELPLEIIVSNIDLPFPENANYNLFKRTFVRENGKVVYNNFSLRKDYKQSEVGTPDYSNLLLDQYISVIEIANPMHSLWSDGRWNKLTMAHGCYWGKCTFCDISLDYIKVYEPIAARLLVDRVEELIAQTGEYGFHFVDEAAPPALMREFALEVIRRKLTITWWTNIRFEKSFTKDLCKLLKASGCIAISGGLEVASDRLLALIDKGVTVAQVAQVTRNFRESEIMVHSYLMYGYPTQTIQETIDSLEMVRQLFELGVLQSGFWHQFALTAHSPIGLAPAEYGIIPEYKEISFANNDIQFEDSTGVDHDQFSFGLKKSLFNYMHGVCFDFQLQEWFDFEVPDTTVDPNYISECLQETDYQEFKVTDKVYWLWTIPESETFTKTKKGQAYQNMRIIVHQPNESAELIFPQEEGAWLMKQLAHIVPERVKLCTMGILKNSFERDFEDFEIFWYSKPMEEFKSLGLLVF